MQHSAAQNTKRQRREYQYLKPKPFGGVVIKAASETNILLQMHEDGEGDGRTTLCSYRLSEMVARWMIYAVVLCIVPASLFVRKGGTAGAAC